MNRLRRLPRSRMRSHTPILIVGAIMSIFGIGFALNSQSIAHARLTRAGYTDITMTGWKPFTLMCNEQGIAQGFRAGDRSGYVCVNPIYSYIVD